MKFHIIIVSWLVLTVGLLTWAGSAAAEDADSPRLSSPVKHAESAAGDLPDLISMATELGSRWGVLEKDIIALFDLPATQKSLAQMAKETNKLSRDLNILKRTSNCGYDQLLEVKAQIDRKAAELQVLIQHTNEAIDQVELWKKEWADEGASWEKLQSSLLKQVSSRALEPTFAKARHTITGSQNLITQTLEPLLSQLQAAEIIRASQASLELQLDALVSVLRDNLTHKTAPSMFSAGYYSGLSGGSWKELSKSLRSVSWPELEVYERRGWLIFIQVFFSLVLSVGIFQQRGRLREKAQWRFIAERPLETGIFVAAATTSLFYGPVPGIWRLMVQCVVIISLARLVVAFVENVDRRKRWLVYGLSICLITTRLFGVFGLPLSIFRLYIFSAALIGIVLCLRHSIAGAHRGGARLYTWALRLGGALCLLILIAETGGYSALSAHLLESSLKTIFIVLAGWMLMVMLRGILEWAVNSPPLKKIPFLQVKTHIIISRSALLTNLFAATFTGTLILVAWRVYGNPAEAIQAVWSFGVTLGDRRITAGLILSAAALLYCAFFISWAVQTMLMDGLFAKRELPVGARLSMARLVHYGFVFLGFLLAMLTLGVQLRDFTIIAGALGVGIGFGLQGIINNFVSGLILLFERPVKVGDYIELGGQRSEIKKIGLRATLVQTLDRSEIVVPNSDLISNQVTNWTLSDRYAGITIPVGVAYGSDVPRVMQTLLECAQGHARVVAHPAPKVLLMGFGESSLNFELRGWIAEVDDMLQIKSELHQEINRKFRSLEIQIPFPQQDLHVHVVENSAPAASGESKDRHLSLHAR